MPIIRVLSGLALGLAAVAFFIVTASAATDAPWVGPVVGGTLIAGSLTALGAGLWALSRRNGPTPTWVLRVGIGILAGTAVIGALALPVAIRIGGDLWLAIEAALLLGAVAFVVLGTADLRRADVRSTVGRGWMAVGAACLVGLAAILVLD